MILGATGISQFGLVHAQTFEKGRGKRARYDRAGDCQTESIWRNRNGVVQLDADFRAKYCKGKVDGVNSGTRQGVDGGNKSYAEEQSRTVLRLSSG